MDEGDFLDDRKPTREVMPVGDTLNRLAMVLCCEALVIILVSGRCSVWELKWLIEKLVGRFVKATWTMLVLSRQVLAEAASPCDARHHGWNCALYHHCSEVQIACRDARGGVALLDAFLDMPLEDGVLHDVCRLNTSRMPLYLFPVILR